ncbi:LysR family transcriptional regulator [Paeniglutamicibacter antarcticus]|uniref:LysR family transcriptional regulator n=1 Tax=Paeniglutamicibacter antarcticus TaxID=494023 RepID=A0ABP9TMK4_9MICC
MVNPVHLRTLLEVVAHNSFAAAALAMGYTPSAVSQQMSSLERDTGTTLFARSAKSIEPTPAALTMVRHAQRVLTDIDALMAATSTPDLDPGGNPLQELRIGIFPSLATFAVPRLLGSPGWERLGIALRVNVGEPHQTITGLRRDGDLDLSLIFQVGQAGLAWPAKVERQWLGDDPFRVVVPSSWKLGGASVFSATQLADMPWIMHHPGTSDATVISRMFSAFNIHPRVVAHSDDFNASLHMVAAGLGAALVPELAMRRAPEGIQIIDAPEIRLARSIFALHPEGRDNPKVGVFMDLLAKVMAELSLGSQRR